MRYRVGLFHGGGTGVSERASGVLGESRWFVMVSFCWHWGLGKKRVESQREVHPVRVVVCTVVRLSFATLMLIRLMGRALRWARGRRGRDREQFSCLGGLAMYLLVWAGVGGRITYWCRVR